MKTLVIAEAGVNHNGSMELAKKLVDVAVSAGADIVKFQTFNAERLATSYAEKASYQSILTGDADSQLQMLRKYELTEKMHIDLIKYCNNQGIEFFSTGFDLGSVDLLIKLGANKFKIPSGEITNTPYLRHIGKQGKEVLMSTGMADLEEIGFALKILEESGTPRSLVTVLQCTTEYPAPMKSVNLLAMLTIRDSFNVRIGYSDHTEGIEVSTAAVALGATVIEKHFTLDKTLPGPDHASSLAPSELKKLVRAIRNIEVALGSPEKSPSLGEMKNRKAARKSIVASKLIKKGEIFSENNLTTKRPGDGLSPTHWQELIGLTAANQYQEDDQILTEEYIRDSLKFFVPRDSVDEN